MPLGIRPKPKPNPDAIRINSNFPNLNDGKDNKKQLGMGNAGNLNTLIKLYCDLQTYGFCVVRQGHREGLPIDKPNVWVFCPLLKKNFPRDRKLCEECKSCSHFKGVSRDLSLLNAEAKENKPFIHMVKPKLKEAMKKEIGKEEEIEKERIALEKTNRKWLEEEKRIFGEK
jgi:hypothetical protein